MVGFSILAVGFIIYSSLPSENIKIIIATIILGFNVVLIPQLSSIMNLLPKKHRLAFIIFAFIAFYLSCTAIVFALSYLHENFIKNDDFTNEVPNHSILVESQAIGIEGTFKRKEDGKSIEPDFFIKEHPIAEERVESRLPKVIEVGTSYFDMGNISNKSFCGFEPKFIVETHDYISSNSTKFEVRLTDEKSDKVCIFDYDDESSMFDNEPHKFEESKTLKIVKIDGNKYTIEQKLSEQNYEKPLYGFAVCSLTNNTCEISIKTIDIWKETGISMVYSEYSMINNEEDLLKIANVTSDRATWRITRNSLDFEFVYFKETSELHLFIQGQSGESFLANVKGKYRVTKSIMEILNCTNLTPIFLQTKNHQAENLDWCTFIF